MAYQVREEFVCNIDHRLDYVKQCYEKVVYEFPMTCGAMYVGETGLCAITRLRQHDRSMDEGNSTLARHICCEKKCEPQLDKTKIVCTIEDTKERRDAEKKRILCHVKRKTRCVNVVHNPYIYRTAKRGGKCVVDVFCRGKVCRIPLTVENCE